MKSDGKQCTGCGWQCKGEGEEVRFVSERSLLRLEPRSGCNENFGVDKESDRQVEGT